jgi:hypothetical protein
MRFTSFLCTLAGLAAFSATALGDGATTVVTPTNMDGWAEHNFPAELPVVGPDVTFETGPASPPCGTGSAEFRVGPDGNAAARLRNADYAGVRLDTLTELSYSTYVEANLDTQAVYIILNVDHNDDGAFDDQLFFEPAYQTGTFSGDPVPNQGTVLLNTWQTWDALAGGWWALEDGAFGPPLITLDTYLLEHPDATIVNTNTGRGGVALVAGFGAGAWDNFVGNADCFTIGVHGESVTYDFELVADSDGDGVPDGQDECPESDLRPFVDVNGAAAGETTIPNTVSGDGCSIQDDVEHCRTAAKNHGQFVKCIGDLSRDLEQEGRITKEQGKDMRSAAAKSDIGKK